jgi:hypothetical protein
MVTTAYLKSGLMEFCLKKIAITAGPDMMDSVGPAAK